MVVPPPASCGDGLPPPHELLGVPPRGASPATIRSCFIREAKRWHPDKRPQDESEEERESARARFVAVHAAYELLVNSPAGRQHGEHNSAPALATMFAGSADALDEARARRAEAEEYVRDLWVETFQGKDWRPEEKQVLQAAWRRAFRALESLRREEAAAEVALGYRRALEKGPGMVPEPPVKPSIDGPRTMSDHMDGVGEAFRELYEDFYGAYFEAWKAVKPTWLPALM